jgi:hypothetical protein
MAHPENRRTLLLIGCALAGLALNGWVAVANRSSWNVDFTQYYSAGKLVGTGNLYDWDVIRSMELERSPRAVPFSRIPANALLFKPLAALPWPAARAIWLCAGLAALAGFLFLWPFSGRAWPFVVLCWSMPVAMCLAFGQDSIAFLFFMALGFRLLIGGYDFWAGLAFSACIAKPHLALLLPVYLIAQGKWKTIVGGAAGGTASILLSFAVEGKDWPQRMLGLTRVPEFDPAAARMPNLRGLLSFLGGSFGVEVALGLVVAAVFWFLSRRQPLPIMGSLVLAGGLLLSHHAYFYDAVLLVPALMLPFESLGKDLMRNWALLLITPLPYLFLLTNMAIVGHIAITGYTLALIGVTVISQRADGTEQEIRSLPQYPD